MQGGMQLCPMVTNISKIRQYEIHVAREIFCITSIDNFFPVKGGLM